MQAYRAGCYYGYLKACCTIEHKRFVGVVATAIVAPWAKIEVKDLWRFLYQPVVGGPWGALIGGVVGYVAGGLF